MSYNQNFPIQLIDTGSLLRNILTTILNYEEDHYIHRSLVNSNLDVRSYGRYSDGPPGYTQATKVLGVLSQDNQKRPRFFYFSSHTLRINHPLPLIIARHT